MINFQTPDLLQQADHSFREAYRHERLLIVDNGARDHSPELVKSLVTRTGGQTEAIRFPRNLFHGPAMHRVLTEVPTAYVYFFDSDTRTERSGFLEGMLTALQRDEHNYVAGQIQYVNKRGFPSESGIPVPVTAHMLVRKRIYLALPPFEHHGSPVLKNCIKARELGYRLCAFPLETYVHHKCRGTAERFGYQLGIRSKFDYVLNKLGF